MLVGRLPLVDMVTDFSWWPNLPEELNITFMVPPLPGKIGSCGYSPMVQPQEPVALLTMSGLLPLFMNIEEAGAPSFTWISIVSGKNGNSMKSGLTNI